MAQRQVTASDWLTGGEMGKVIRSMDWSKTPLGPIDAWPQSLRTTVSLCLASTFPISLAWGPGHVQIYNDGYWPICGGKHPHSMGQDFRECWASAWPAIGEAFDRALAGQASYIENRRMFLDRNGYLEETFFTFSFSPVRDETGGVGGLFHPVTETTARMLSERRTRALRDLAARAGKAQSVEEACALAAETLAECHFDLPFLLLYLFDARGKEARLVGSARLPPGTAASQPVVDLEAPPSAWPLAAVARSGAAQEVGDLERRFGPLSCGPYPESPKAALTLPITAPGSEGPAGVLVAGVSPRLPLDEAYRSFYDLLAAGVTAAVANARAHEEERKRAEALAELDRAKTAFFSNVSHEFRTPLTLMLGPVEEVLAKPANRVLPENREILEVVHRNGLRLLKLVNTLLDFSRIEAGRAQAVYEAANLAGLTADLASTFRSLVEKAGLRLAVDCPPLPEPVYVDREMWEKVVLNLLSNAFKFTFAGEIGVTLRGAGDHAGLEVRDTGIGIPPEELPRVFERFHRVKGARGRSYEGSGIGLALVQDLVRLHGGTVGVESTVGQGTTFRIRMPFGTHHLPADRIGAPRTAASTALRAEAFVEEALRWLPSEKDEGGRMKDEPEPASGSSFILHPSSFQGRPRVLWADDNADMRDYVCRLLAGRYEVEAVADGQAALESARRRPPDLVLTDVMMPNLDGFGLLEALRADAATRTVPVVLLSARAGEESRVEGLQAGADDYLTKPFSARELLARVEANLRLARLRQEVEHAAGREEALREADRRKDEFLSMLAHELRNPLTPICNGLHILRQPGADRQAAERAQSMMERQVHHLVRIVDDLLDVSRIQRGKITLKPERLDLARQARVTAEDHRPSFEEAGLRLEPDLPEVPVWVQADPTRLAQVLDNLLQNAVKFTGRGGRVAVRVSADAGHRQAVLSVRDTGVGIEPAMLPRLFDAFAQADRSLDRSKGGLGLGLALVKGLAELHGGEAHAASAGPDCGAEFTVRLPMQPEPAALSRMPDAPAPTGERLRVLVVEDNRDAADSLKMLLELYGYEVAVAYTGPAGVQTARQWRPAVVLCDIGLPGLDGYGVVGELRRDPATAAARVIAVTGYGQDEDRRRSREAGFDEHLVKPVDPAVLRPLLARTA